MTTYITNNGDGTADVKAVAVCSNGNTYTQNYKGLKKESRREEYESLSAISNMVLLNNTKEENQLSEEPY